MEKTLIENRCGRPLYFYSENDGHSFEWQYNGRFIVFRIWPPEDGLILIEYHNVSTGYYFQRNIPEESLYPVLENDIIPNYLIYCCE